jgi:hypothetical protein
MLTVIAEASQTAESNFLTATSSALTASPTNGAPAFAGGLGSGLATPTDTPTLTPTSTNEPTVTASPTATNTATPLPNPAPAASSTGLFGIPMGILLYFACGLSLIFLLFGAYLYFIVFARSSRS